LACEEWGEYELSTFVLNLPTLKTQDLYDFYKFAHRKFYFRPKVMLKRLLNVTQPKQLLDLVHAFFFIVLRRKVGKRGEVRADWVDLKKEDFFDVTFAQKSTPLLTYISRQEGQTA